MSRVSETLRWAGQRVDPERFASSLTISNLSALFEIPMQTGITFVINALLNEVNPSLLRIAAVGTLGAANILSVLVETRALRTEKYSASPISTILNTFFTERPLVASIGGSALDHVLLTALNPIFYAALIKGDNQLLLGSLASTSLTLTSWHIAMNSLIAAGKIRPVIDRMRIARQSIMGMFNRTATH